MPKFNLKTWYISINKDSSYQNAQNDSKEEELQNFKYNCTFHSNSLKQYQKNAHFAKLYQHSGNINFNNYFNYEK